MRKYVIIKPHLKMPKINNFYICVELMRKPECLLFFKIILDGDYWGKEFRNKLQFYGQNVTHS